MTEEEKANADMLKQQSYDQQNKKMMDDAMGMDSGQQPRAEQPGQVDVNAGHGILGNVYGDGPVKNMQPVNSFKSPAAAQEQTKAASPPPYNIYDKNGPEVKAGQQLVDNVFPSPKEIWEKKRRDRAERKASSAAQPAVEAAAPPPKQPYNLYDPNGPEVRIQNKMGKAAGILTGHSEFIDNRAADVVQALREFPGQPPVTTPVEGTMRKTMDGHGPKQPTQIQPTLYTNDVDPNSFKASPPNLIVPTNSVATRQTLAENPPNLGGGQQQTMEQLPGVRPQPTVDQNATGRITPQAAAPQDPQDQSALNNFFSPNAIWKEDRNRRAANNVQAESGPPPENASHALGSFTKNTAIPAIDTAGRYVAGGATVVPRGLAYAADNFMRGFTGKEENPDAFNVFPFDRKEGQQAPADATTKPTAPADAATKPAAAQEAPAATAGAAIPGPTTKPTPQAEPSAAGQQAPVTTNQFAKPPEMQFNNKFDQETYDRGGLKEALRSPNPSIQHTLMKDDSGKNMIRETMNGGPGAPALRQPINPALWTGTQEALIETNKANAAYNAQRMAEWTGRNSQWAAEQGGVPLQQAQAKEAEARTSESYAKTAETFADIKSKNTFMNLGNQMIKTTDPAKKAAIMGDMLALQGKEKTGQKIYTEKTIDPESGLVVQKNYFEDGSPLVHDPVPLPPNEADLKPNIPYQTAKGVLYLNPATGKLALPGTFKNK